MRKNDKKRAGRQRVKNSVPEPKQSVGQFVRELLYETVIVSGLKYVRGAAAGTSGCVWSALSA
ncbi:MAG: hypothetical protein ACRENP_05440 [Longimicrobiales bacterium]